MHVHLTASFTIASLFVALNAGDVMAQTHCQPDEIVYFSCPIKNSRKIASLCGGNIIDSQGARNDNAWLQYRFGQLKNPEFVFPRERNNSLSYFKGEKHQTPQLYFNEISFSNSGVGYALVFYQGEPGFFGVKVRDQNRELEFPCAKYPQTKSQENGNDFFTLIIELL